VFKFVLQRTGDGADRGRVIATAYYTVAAFALVISVVLAFFAGPLARALLGSAAYSTALAAISREIAAAIKQP
jgi:hypothetical protein